MSPRLHARGRVVRGEMLDSAATVAQAGGGSWHIDRVGGGCGEAEAAVSGDGRCAVGQFIHGALFIGAAMRDAFRVLIPLRMGGLGITRAFRQERGRVVRRRQSPGGVCHN